MVLGSLEIQQGGLIASRRSSISLMDEGLPAKAFKHTNNASRENLKNSDRMKNCSSAALFEPYEALCLAHAVHTAVYSHTSRRPNYPIKT